MVLISVILVVIICDEVYDLTFTYKIGRFEGLVWKALSWVLHALYRPGVLEQDAELQPRSLMTCVWIH